MGQLKNKPNFFLSLNQFKHVEKCFSPKLAFQMPEILLHIIAVL